MGYIIILLHYLVLAAIAGLQRAWRIGSEHLLGAQKIRGFTLWDTIYYHDGHTWALPEMSGRVRVGMDDFAAKLLGTIDRISLPSIGEVLRKGQDVIKFKCGSHPAWAVCPIDGTVTSVNGTTGRDPSVITRDPYGRGWVFTLMPHDGGLKTLHKGEKAREWLLHETEKLHQMLASEMGVTMADGGGMAKNLSAKLSSEQWHEVMRTFLKAGKQ